MEKRKRKVKYTVQLWHPEEKESPEDMGYSIKSGEAWFHEWGKDLQAGGDELLSQSVAIVEDCDTGQCYAVHPNDVKFIN